MRGTLETVATTRLPRPDTLLGGRAPVARIVHPISLDTRVYRTLTPRHFSLTKLF